MPLSPFAGTMRQLMSAYHDEMNARVEATVADLQLRWQPVKRALALQIQRLEQQMLAAERAGEPLTLAWLTQARRLAELKAAVEGDVGQFAQTLRQLVGQAQQDAAQLGSTAAQEALAASVPPGMSYTFGVPPRDVLDQLAGAVQPHSPLSTIFDEYGAQAAYNAQQALFTSVALGEGAAQAAQRLVWATDMSASRAEVIARTEIMRSWRGAQMANYRANSDVVDQWEWSCDISPRSCGACLGMDGTLHNMDEELDDHVCGRCSALPVTKPWSEILAGTGVPDDQLAALDQMSAARPQRETGSQWFDRQPPEIQTQILGPAKAAAYQAGDLTLSDLVDYSYSPQWGTSLREASMRDLGLDAQKYLRMARSGMARGASSVGREVEQAATETTATGASTAEQTLADAQARVETMRQQWDAAKAANPNLSITSMPEAQQALYDLAKAQAAVDAEQGGRGAIIYAHSYDDPFGAMDKLNAATAQWFGHTLTRDELGGLVGAPEGAFVEIQGFDYGRLPGLSISLHGPSYDLMAGGWQQTEYDADRYLMSDERGHWMMSNSNFFIREDLQNSGLGAHIFSDEAQTLSDLGVRYIETNAAGSGSGVAGVLAEDANGYYTWPRFGYTGHLPDASRDLIAEAITNGEAPAAWGRYTTIQQLMRTSAGRDWWKTYGSELDGLRFDLRPGSLSMRVLDAYLREKGLK